MSEGLSEGKVKGCGRNPPPTGPKPDNPPPGQGTMPTHRINLSDLPPEDWHHVFPDKYLDDLMDALRPRIEEVCREVVVRMKGEAL